MDFQGGGEVGRFSSVSFETKRRGQEREQGLRGGGGGEGEWRKGGEVMRRGVGGR